MKQSTKYILEGVKNENEKTFMRRVGELLERNGLIEAFAAGVPVAAQIVDEAELIDFLSKKHPEKNNISFKDEPYIKGDGTVTVGIKYVQTRYYKTEEEAKEGRWSNAFSDKTDEHPFPGEYESSDVITINDMPGVEILYV